METGADLGLTKTLQTHPSREYGSLEYLQKTDQGERFWTEEKRTRRYRYTSSL